MRIKLLVQTKSHATPKVVSVLYGCLMDSRIESTLYVKAMWERELGEEIPEGTWYDLWKTHNTVPKLKRIQLEKSNSTLHHN